MKNKEKNLDPLPPSIQPVWGKSISSFKKWGDFHCAELIAVTSSSTLLNEILLVFLPFFFSQFPEFTVSFIASLSLKFNSTQLKSCVRNNFIISSLLPLPPLKLPLPSAFGLRESKSFISECRKNVVFLKETLN